MRKLLNKLINKAGYKCIEKNQWDQLTKQSLQNVPEMTPLELRECDVPNCRVLVNRDKILDFMPQNGIVAELGVALGSFSEKIIRTLQPKMFYAIDLFELEKFPTLWEMQTVDVFNGKTHEEFYAEKFESEISNGIVHLKKGLSWDILAEFQDLFFDVIYIDAGHTYDSVKKDAALASRKIKHDGFLIFNDYIMFDYIVNEPYGVVQVVNELCVHENFEMIYFALQQHMFCDVVLRRKV